MAILISGNSKAVAEIHQVIQFCHSQRMAELKNIKRLDEIMDQIINAHDLRKHQETANGHLSASVRSSTSSPQKRNNINKDMSKLRIFKNFLILSFSFMFVCTAFISMSNLQSSVNHSLGTLSLTIVFLARAISSLFVSSAMICFLGEKCTITVSMLMNCLYFTANFYPQWYTLIPASVILGTTAAPLWSAKCSYLATISQRYAIHVNQPSESYVVPFFGYFFMIFQTSHIWGNLMTHLILIPTNSELEMSISSSSQCGPLFNTWTSHGDNVTGHTLSSIPDNFNLLRGLFTGCAVMAFFLVFVFLDPLDKKTVRVIQKPSLATFLMTLHHMKKPYQLLLIPITTFSGMAQAYLTGTFTKAFVTCSWGVSYVGYVMICFGLTNAICSCALGIKLKPIGRLLIILMATSIVGGMIILMFLWVPTVNGNRTLYFVISGLWGVGDAVFSTYVNAFYGVLFPNDKEAAFSNFRLWQSVGIIISFASSGHFAIPVELTMLATVLMAGTTCYLVIEIHLRFTLNNILQDVSSDPGLQMKDHPNVESYI